MSRCAQRQNRRERRLCGGPGERIRPRRKLAGLVDRGDILSITGHGARAVRIPVMADIDTGGGNALKAAITVPAPAGEAQSGNPAGDPAGGQGAAGGSEAGGTSLRRPAARCAAPGPEGAGDATGPAAARKPYLDARSAGAGAFLR